MAIFGGVPKNDRRRKNKSAYGELDGKTIGFMDDLTPCRINQEKYKNKPWFRLDKTFMDINKSRCFSGPATHESYSAFDFESAKKSFFWYSLTKTFSYERLGYPMYLNHDYLWPITFEKINDDLLKICFSIGFAQNDCIEATFPANNPIEDVPEMRINNPMNPLNPNSFWCEFMKPNFNLDNPKDIYDRLVQSVNNFFKEWEKELGSDSEKYVDYSQPYFIGRNKVLTKQAGLRQINDYAKHYGKEKLIEIYNEIQDNLKLVKESFYAILMDKNGLDYFGKAREEAEVSRQEEKLEEIEKIEERETRKQRRSSNKT